MSSFFRMLEVIHSVYKLRVQLPVAERATLVQIRPQGLKTRMQNARGKQST